jgi:2',3'-cyclic-nucleotide 2'-phosphodiesterase/3'-nucleotidase/5'-nucleotidase
VLFRSHSRVSNRNPSYYRGPQDPFHPYYHLGFRVARNSSSSTGVNETRSTLPTGYQLLQNYPNPFNPSTVISFALPVSITTRLVVYDVLGRELALLVNEPTSAGKHIVSWDAAKFPAGVYFYRIAAGNYTETKKMLLTK